MRKNNTDRTSAKKEQGSRAQFQCPEDLAKFISFVSNIPLGINLVEPKEILKKCGFVCDLESIMENKDISLDATQTIFEECFKDFGINYKTQLLNQVENNLTPYLIKAGFTNKSIKRSVYLLAFQGTYDPLYKLQSYLCAIANFFSNFRKDNYRTISDNELVTHDGEKIALPSFKVQLVREKTMGMIQRPIFNAFVGVDLNRIRSCEICKRIFWANNKNSETCSESCRNALRQRKHRKINKEAVNAKRRESYQLKKKGIVK